MKRLLLLLFTLLFALCGCGRGDLSLPEDPIAFQNGTFVNPDDPEDDYLSIEWNDRTYIPYGGWNGTLRARDIAACLGYLVQDGVPLEDTRICLLTADPDGNYLINTSTNTFMNPPMVFRAIDTVGKAIERPNDIYDLGYDYWK